MFPSEHYWRNPYVYWVSEIPEKWLLFVFYIRDSRIKAKIPAVVEILSLWRRFQPIASLSGPLAEHKGVFWIALDSQFLGPAITLLPHLGSLHQIGDASFLPFRNDAFLSIATEPPDSMAALPMLQEAIGEFYRTLKTNGRLSLLIPFNQVESILNHTLNLGMRLFLASRIDRKGTDVAILAWEKIS